MDLKTARVSKGKTQWDVRKSTGIHQSKVSLIENGYVVPSEMERSAISKYLDLNISDIEWPKQQDWCKRQLDGVF